MRTNVYIDGFNLYYGRLKGQPELKWLDPVRLCGFLLPAGHQLHRVRYFTARIVARPDNLGAPARQDAYLRALQSLPEVSIHHGRFAQGRARMRLANPRPGGPSTVEVLKTEEKATDVNLASHLLLDTFRQECELAVLVSNDSDLCEPLRIVREEFGLPIGILNPFPKLSPWLLGVKPNFIKPIRHGVLRVSQLPPAVELASGAAIHRPKEWT